MTEIEKIITDQAAKKHEKKGIKVEKNQTIVKGQIYGFIGSGYSVKGYGGYFTFTICEAKTNDFFKIPAHWNRDVFTEIDGCGKTYGGSCGGNTEFDHRVARYEKEYPGMIWM